MSAAAIRVSDLGKRYRIGERVRYKSLRESLSNAVTRTFRGGRRTEETIWALKDVSFEVAAGEVVGVIGRNGAGKSTLLKILSRITEPTEGRVELHGRVGSLLEVGTGFHQELTGRENIYLNGAILGMKRAEIDRKFDEIVAFAEVERFLDTPVKHFSTGMYLRLAFAVAAHLEPEILLVDEVLAVGDASFQKKCVGKMDEVARGGRTVLFVSHNLAAIEGLTERALVLDGGRVDFDGPVGPAIHRYVNELLPASDDSHIPAGPHEGSGRLRLTSFSIEDRNGQPLRAARSGMDTVFVLGYSSQDGRDIREVDVGISVATHTQQMLFVLYASYVGQVLASVPRTGEFRCLIRKLPLAEGCYTVGARVLVAGVEADWPRGGVGTLNVEAGDFYGTGQAGFRGNAPLLVAGEWRGSASCDTT